MHSCAANSLEKWDLIFHDLFLCVYKVRVDAFLCCRGPSKMRCHLQTLCLCFILCVLCVLRCWEPWKMKSHRSNFISIIHRICFDAFLRCRGPWKMRSHRASVILIKCIFMHSCFAGGLEGWDLIFHALCLCCWMCVLVHSCAAGSIERWDHLPSFLSMLYILCFDAFVRCWEPCVFWCIPALPGALGDEVSSSKRCSDAS